MQYFASQQQTIIDLTHQIETDMPVYPGDPPVKIRQIGSSDKDIVTTKIFLGSHSGTHIDTPLHFYKNGRDLNQIAMQRFIGSAIKLKLAKVGQELHFQAHQLDKLKLQAPSWILIATGFDSHWREPRYFSEHPCLSIAAAQQLVDLGIGGIGIDCPSVDAPDGDYPVHRLLLSNDFLILENLTNLNKLPETLFSLIVLPLKLAAEAAPVRAVALI